MKWYTTSNSLPGSYKYKIELHLLSIPEAQRKNVQTLMRRLLVADITEIMPKFCQQEIIALQFNQENAWQEACAALDAMEAQQNPQSSDVMSVSFCGVSGSFMTEKTEVKVIQKVAEEMSFHGAYIEKMEFFINPSIEPPSKKKKCDRTLRDEKAISDFQGEVKQNNQNQLDSAHAGSDNESVPRDLNESLPTLFTGTSDFKNFRQNNYLFVDKTLFIKHVLEAENFALLILRPRRFGKTLSISMLKYFLAAEDANENKKLLQLFFRDLRLGNIQTFNKSLSML